MRNITGEEIGKLDKDELADLLENLLRAKEGNAAQEAAHDLILALRERESRCVNCGELLPMVSYDRDVPPEPGDCSDCSDRGEE